MSDECLVEMKSRVYNLTLSPFITLQRSGGEPDSHHQLHHPEDVQQAGGSVSMPVLQTKRVMHALLFFFSHRVAIGAVVS